MLIYLCEFSEHDQVIPRHHITGTSLCRVHADTDLSYVESIIPRDVVEELIKYKDLVIVDKETMAKVLNDVPGGHSYLRLILLDEER